MDLQRLLENDCNGLVFIETTEFSFESFYGSKTASEVAEFWSMPRAFTLPMDGPEKIATVDRQVRELIFTPVEKQLPDVDVEMHCIELVGKDVVDCRSVVKTKFSAPLQKLVHHQTKVKPANTTCCVPSEFLEPKADAYWAFVDRKHPVETTCTVMQKYIETRFAGFVRPNDATGYDSLPSSGSNKELLQGFQQHWVYIHSENGMFPAHVEDCASHSINYNFGPCSKVWFMVPPEFIKKLENVIVAHMDETRRADFAPTGLSWRGVLHSRRFWPHPRILLAAGIPVYCAIQEPDTAIFTAAGYVHWGYAAPHPSGGHSFAVAWNTFPSACFPAAASFRSMQRGLADLPTTPRIIQSIGEYDKTRPLRVLVESFNLVGLATRQLHEFISSPARRDVLRPGIFHAVTVVAAAIDDFRKVDVNRAVQLPTEDILTRDVADIGQWCCSKCEIQIDLLWYESAEGKKRCLGCGSQGKMRLHCVVIPELMSYLSKVLSLGVRNDKYEFPCSPDEWNALRTQADTVLRAVEVPDRDTAKSTADACAAAEARVCSDDNSGDSTAPVADVDAQIGAGAPKRKPAHPVGDMQPTDMPVERKRVKGMSPTTSGQSDSPS